MLKIIKQELLFIPVMLVLLELFRGFLFHFYPETALFDRGSIMESFLVSLWQMTWVTSASWLLIMIVFPKAGKSLQNFYNNFESFRPEFKESFAVKLFLVLFLSLVFLCGMRGQTMETQVRKSLVDSLNSQLHVRELTGRNDGKEVEKYLAFVQRFKGDAWCAAYVSYNLNSVGITKPVNPVTAWAPSFANTRYVIWSQTLIKSRKAKDPLPGDIFTLYYPAQGRVGHVGFITGETPSFFITNEGNTGLSGTREGSGVHALKRSKQKVYAIANYITPYLKQNAKTIHINTAIGCYIVQPENYRISYFNHQGPAGQYPPGEEYRLACKEGFYLVPGFSPGRERIYHANKRGCKSGQGRNRKPAAHCNRNGTFAGHRVDYKWEAASQLCLQGPGAEVKAKRKACYGYAETRPLAYTGGEKRKGARRANPKNKGNLPNTQAG